LLCTSGLLHRNKTILNNKSYDYFIETFQSFKNLSELLCNSIVDNLKRTKPQEEWVCLCVALDQEETGFGFKVQALSPTLYERKQINFKIKNVQYFKFYVVQ